MTGLRPGVVLITAALALFAAGPAAAGPAAAATRHAAPGGGTSNDCTATDPAHVCEIHRAIAVAGSGDEVVLEPGTYDIATEVDVAKPLTLRGVAGQPRPRLVGRAGVTHTLDVNPASGDILRHLAVESQTASFGDAVHVQTPTGGSATVEDVIASASGTSSPAFWFDLLDRGGTLVLRDSVARTTGATSAGVRATRPSANQPLDSSLDLRNVTADARGTDSPGVVAEGRQQMSGCANITLNVRNAIATGTRADFAAYGYFGTCTGTIDVYSSNWRTQVAGSGQSAGGSIVSHEGNKTALPAFVDAAAGDYHQLVSSPTVDAGLPDSLLGTTDIDGDPRFFGSEPDMGADEYVPPPPNQGGDGGGGTPPGGGGTTPPDVAPPAFSATKVTNSKFAVDTKGTAETAVAARAKKGTAFVYTLSEPARVVFTIEQKLPGRKVGKTCKKPSRSNRRRKRCTRYKLFGRFAQDGVAGQNTKTFSGKIGKKKMKPGAYRASLVATDAAGNRSPAKRINLRVLKR